MIFSEKKCLAFEGNLCFMQNNSTVERIWGGKVITKYTVKVWGGG